MSLHGSEQSVPWKAALQPGTTHNDFVHVSARFQTRLHPAMAQRRAADASTTSICSAGSLSRETKDCHVLLGSDKRLGCVARDSTSNPGHRSTQVLCLRLNTACMGEGKLRRERLQGYSSRRVIAKEQKPGDPRDQAKAYTTSTLSWPIAGTEQELRKSIAQRPKARREEHRGKCKRDEARAGRHRLHAGDGGGGGSGVRQGGAMPSLRCWSDLSATLA